MGATNVYASRRRVFITPHVGSPVKYGFATNIDSVESTALGHTAVDTAAGVVVFGCDSPKPGRAKRLPAGSGSSQYTVSSWINAPLLSSPPANYVIVRQPRARGAVGGVKTKAVFVAFSGYKYAWLMPTRLYTIIAADRAGLGIEDCVPSDFREYIWGSNNFRPPIASKSLPGSGGGIDTYSTFYDPDGTLPGTWTAKQPAVIPG